MEKEIMEDYRKNHEAMKAWNDRRAKAEKEGLKKFYALRELWRQQKTNTQNR